MSQIIISDITPLESRAKYTGVVGATWGVAACIGPLLGGVFTEKASWRWCFFVSDTPQPDLAHSLTLTPSFATKVNLPCGAIALALLVFFLKLNPPNPPKLSFLLANFDFAGLGLLVSGLVVLLVGFTSGEASWSSAQTISCLVVGVVVLGVAICVELRTKRSPIIPPRLFRIRTSAGLLLGCFLHSFSFISLSYYEPLYFQALGSTPLMSGVLLMPFSVGTAVVGVLAGFLAARIKRTKELIIGSYLIAVVGYALLATLDETSSRAKQILYLLVAAIGVGPLFQLPMLHLQASMPQKDMATSTATLALLRSIGGTVGISVVGAVYANRLNKGLEGIEGYDRATAAAAVGNVQGLTKIEVRFHAAVSWSCPGRRLTFSYARRTQSPSRCGNKSCTPTLVRSHSRGSSARLSSAPRSSPRSSSSTTPSSEARQLPSLWRRARIRRTSGTAMSTTQRSTRRPPRRQRGRTETSRGLRRGSTAS